MTPVPVAPFVALLNAAPDFIDSLSDDELVALYYADEIWRRPDQQLPDPADDWRSQGFLGGRGQGKTWAIASWINRQVERGVYKSPGLAAPTGSPGRVEEVQWKSLIETAPPWFRPEIIKDHVVWPNGVEAEYFTPEQPGRPRSSNLDLAWLSELVDWQSSTRAELYNNITTATRVGRAHVLWDTTSRGKNEVILGLMANHERDPSRHRIQRGTMFDNPLLTPEYIADEITKYTGREYDEEVLGKVYAESAGALWQQSWLDDHRVYEHPELELLLVSIDPGQATGPNNDPTGIVTGGRAPNGQIYIVRDQTERVSPEVWGDRALDEHERGAAGAVIERNKVGDTAVAVLRARAERRGVEVRVLDRKQLFPRRTARVFYVREIWAASGKATRASGPAALYETGRVHHVGLFPELELQQTIYVPGSAKSPNNLDAVSQLVIELAGLDSNRPGQARLRESVKGTSSVAGSLAAALRSRVRSQRL